MLGQLCGRVEGPPVCKGEGNILVGGGSYVCPVEALLKLIEVAPQVFVLFCDVSVLTIELVVRVQQLVLLLENHLDLRSHAAIVDFDVVEALCDLRSLILADHVLHLVPERLNLLLNCRLDLIFIFFLVFFETSICILRLSSTHADSRLSTSSLYLLLLCTPTLTICRDLRALQTVH